ncbi:hypothetical protein SG34_031405 [Thalassomonas viridans]|uniref:Aminopeptidase N n=1 Tax=Thalassomonas viridans TaxID=137584 RepID=A0AAE9ZGJ9_9GAMM|nr:M1 family aminopeptidase [Thalassomonas viridans]WDE09272.1 hypothetical protein SG34_031405 [Thalassomonas viridans]
MPGREAYLNRLNPLWWLGRLRAGMLPVLFWLAALPCGAGEPSPDTGARQDIDFLAYRAHLEPDPARQSIKGRVEIAFKVLTAGVTRLPLTAINKDIYAVRGAGIQSHRVAGEYLYVEYPAKTLKKDQVYRLTVEYLATPDKGISFYPDHFYTHYHTEQWLVAHEDIGDRARIEMWLTLPRHMKAVANGELMAVKASGDKRIHHWNETRERPLFTFGFAAGNFTETLLRHKGMEFRYLSLVSREDEISRMFADVRAIYDFFEQKSGMPLQQKRYTYVLTEGNAMQEASGFSLIGRNIARDVLDEPRESWLITHELAHEWWGNAISAASWSDFWLNEGLVQFLVAAFKAQQYGQDEYDREMVLFKESIHRRLKKSPVLRAVSPQQKLSFADYKKHYRGIVYSKGGYIFHMLKTELGEQDFWRGLKHYSQANWESTVSSRQLQQAFESASGRNLEHFFNTWVYRPQQIELAARVSYQPGRLAIRFRQTQQEPADFHFWLAVDDGGQRRLKRVNISGAEHLVEIKMQQPPQGLWLDYYHYLPLPIKVTGADDYIQASIFSEVTSLTRYWALKSLVTSDYCRHEPQRIERTFARLKQVDTSRIIHQAIAWWREACPG